MDAHRISVIPIVAIVLVVVFAGLSNLVVAQVAAQNSTSPAAGLGNTVAAASPAPGIQWQKTFSGIYEANARYAQQTTDGGYMLAGTTWPTNGSVGGAYIAKTDASGNLMWQTNVSPPAGAIYLQITSAQQTKDGGYILAGYFWLSWPSLDQAYLIKIDANGNLAWQKTFSSSTYSEDIYSVQQTTDGGYILAVMMVPSTGGGPESLVKTDANGTLTWQKTYNGLGNATASAVQQTADGGYILTGGHETGSGYWGAYLVKTDANGTLTWQKTFSVTGVGARASAVQQTTDGGYILAGWAGPGADVGQAYLVKTDANGTLTWQKTYNGGGSWTAASSIEQTSDGGYVVAAGTGNMAAGYSDLVFKTDANGNLVWQEMLSPPGHGFVASVQQTNDGGYIVAGETDSGQALLIKLGGSLIASSPAVCAQGSNSLYLFVNGTDSALWYTHWNGTTWSAWQSIGGVLTSAPAVASQANGVIDVFVRGSDDAVWQKTTSSNGTSWSGWTSLGGQIVSGTGPTVCAQSASSPDVFVQGTDHALWWKHWDGTTWSAWKSLGGTLTSSPAAMSPGNGLADVFVRGANGAVYEKTTSNGGTSWSGWTSLGGQIPAGTTPAACSWGSGRVDVFVQGTDSSLWHKTYTSSTWSGWQSLGGVLTSSPAAAAAAGSSRIDVFVLGSDNGLWQKTYSNRQWGSWTLPVGM